jgi:hypothetical protein
MTFKTEIITILDRSGSMFALIDDTIGGYNDFIAKQRALPGEARSTLILFDHLYEQPYAAVPLANVPALDRNTDLARGNTALLDAIGRALTEHGQRIATEKWAEKVMVVIITDGHENHSREFKLAQIKAMIEHAQEVGGWEFLYLSADPNAFADAGSMGIGANKTAAYQHSGQGTQAVYAAASASSAALRSHGAVGNTLDGLKLAGGGLDVDKLIGQPAGQVPPTANVPPVKPVPGAGPSQSTAGSTAP